MTDRELLELAAKAAGYSFAHKLTSDAAGKRTGPFIAARSRWRQWNPLTDDGDALRLAVKLFEPDEIAEIWSSVASLRAGCLELDELSATRRAIVRAAAEIGRNMLSSEP